MARITTPYAFHSTAAEVIDGIDLTGKQVIVTGGAAGIGIETARALAHAGATVTLAVRRPEIAEGGGEGTARVDRQPDGAGETVGPF